MYPSEEKLGQLVVDPLMFQTFEDKTYSKSIVVEMNNGTVSTYYNNGWLMSECKYPNLRYLANDWIRSRDSLTEFKKLYVSDSTLLGQVKTTFPDVKNIYLREIQLED